LIERRELLQVGDNGSVSCEALPIDRDRLLKLIGLGILILGLIVYAIVAGSTPSDSGDSVPI